MDEKPELASSGQAPQLDAIRRATLTPLVRSALGSETIEVTSWDYERLHGGIGMGTAIYRFAGQGRDQDQKVPWSLILKTLCPAEDNAHVSAWNYYKREADAYQSGLLADLPGGLAAPRCFGVLEHPDGTCWIWLEDVEEGIGAQWPLEHFGVVARHAGQLNGAYLVERSLPSWLWLSSDWLRGYIALSAPAIPLIRNSLDHPLVRRGFPSDASDRLFRLWEERYLYLDALDRLPQTLCHLDIFRRNLFARKTADGDDQTVAIDWAFAGRGAIGEELVPLVLASVAFHEVDLAQTQALEEIVFEGYLEGLHDAGWRGDPRQVRLGYTAGSLRFRFAELNRAMVMILDESQHPFMEQAFGRSMEEIEDHWAQVGNLVYNLTDEARDLIDILGCRDAPGGALLQPRGGGEMDERLEAQMAQLAAIDQTTLTPLLRSALGSETVKVVNWEFEQLHGGIAAGTAVYRFSGQARDQDQTIPWSLILKPLRPEGGSTDASAWDYFKREVGAYQSGWLDDLSGGLAAPRCFGVLDHAEGACWMWLEDIRDRFASDWPLEHYGLVARHLGQFNGAYLVDRPLPAWSWLSSDWLRCYVEQSAPAMEPLRDALASPWGRRWLPEEDRDQFFHLWAERALYLDALDRLPQTICHFDIFRLNLFARKAADGDDQTVLIDWAFVGRGPIGADLNPLVWMSIALAGVERDKVQELEEIVFEGYLEGLLDAGWQGDPRQVRLGYTAASVRFLFPEIGRWVAIILDESLHAGFEQSTGMPIGQIFDSIVLMRRSFFGQLDEARGLMGILS